jgi:hypothetical protein
LYEYPKKSVHLDDPGVGVKVMLKWNIKEYDSKFGLVTSASKYGLVVGFCKYGTEPSGSIILYGFLDYLSSCCLSKKDSAR